MNDEISNLLEKLTKASGVEKKKLFVMFCLKLIECKEKDEMREEDAAYKIVGAVLQSDYLFHSPEFDVIFDTASTTEMPRELSYAQSMGQWDAKTADTIKEKEWRELTVAVHNARKFFKLE